ncbi:hypothetical protein HNY73_006225 [Argiope bruennichi]|uniref:Uncharacterized protein n=1 Tax=Argiope bruennichi TaxID=94029 RepID=A0A8T0FNZ8_ARGBR|nr:hypothetical protein HNY73_006225 [Argiope bruennichi]
MCERKLAKLYAVNRFQRIVPITSPAPFGVKRSIPTRASVGVWWVGEEETCCVSSDEMGKLWALRLSPPLPSPSEVKNRSMNRHVAARSSREIRPQCCFVTSSSPGLFSTDSGIANCCMHRFVSILDGDLFPFIFKIC